MTLYRPVSNMHVYLFLVSGPGSLRVYCGWTCNRL